jgi:hypothetical protein
VTGLDLALSPAELEAETDVLQLVAGTGLSHAAVAQSMWNDMYGDVEDPEVFGLGDESRSGKGLPTAVWRSFKSEWYQLACTDDPRYDVLRAKVKDLRGTPATVVVSTIAAGLAATLGVAAGVLMPFIAVLLHGAVTVGNRVMCRALTGLTDPAG